MPSSNHESEPGQSDLYTQLTRCCCALAAKYPAASNNLFRLDLNLKMLADCVLFALRNAPMPAPGDLDPEAAAGRIIADLLIHCESAADEFVRTAVGNAIVSLVPDAHAGWEGISRPNLYLQSRAVRESLADGTKAEIENVLKKIAGQTKKARGLNRPGRKQGKPSRNYLSTCKPLHDKVARILKSLESQGVTDLQVKRPPNEMLRKHVERAYLAAYRKSAELSVLNGMGKQKDMISLACEIIIRHDPYLDKRTVRRHYIDYLKNRSRK